jgi:hypothetical protein
MRLPPSIAIAVLVAAAAASCSRPSSGFCCTTADTCAAAGLDDELRPCGVGQACKAYECIAAECATSTDCTSAEAPTCAGGLCVAGCTIDDDCAGVAGRPRCDAATATCVGCTSGDQCPAARSICDADTRSCRGCTADDQCASGVCIEATGRCAADAEILYVTQTGADAGTCPKDAPCKTLAFAMGLTSPARNVIRILGPHFYLGNSSAYLSNSIVLDGSNTTLTSGVSPAILVGGPGALEGVRLLSTDAFTSVIKVQAGGGLVLTHSTIEDGQIEVFSGASLDAVNVQMRNGNIECKSGGDLSVRRSRLEQSYIDSACKLVFSANRVEPALVFLGARFQAPSQLIENNVFIGNDAEIHMILVNGGSGSVFRFNTIVNSSPVTGSAAALGCEAGVDVTSNIIAYNSTHPILCEARYSLFDAAGAQEVHRGFGNQSADVVTFFKDRQAGNFHLAPNSPARGFGEPGLVTTDLDGNARPTPVGSLPDVGAYEAP